MMMMTTTTTRAMLLFPHKLTNIWAHTNILAWHREGTMRFIWIQKLDPAPAILRWNNNKNTNRCGFSMVFPQIWVAFDGLTVLPSAVSCQAMKPWQPPWTPNGRNMIPRLGLWRENSDVFQAHRWPKVTGMTPWFQENLWTSGKEDERGMIRSDMIWLYHFI